MPAQERIRLEDEDGFLPGPDPAGEEDEPEAIGWGGPRLPNLAVEDDELLAEEGVLGNELGIAASEIEGRAEQAGGAGGKRDPKTRLRSVWVGQTGWLRKTCRKALEGQSRPANGVYCRSDRGLLSGGWGFRPGQHDRGWGPSRSRCTRVSAPSGFATACTAKSLPGPAGGPSRSGKPRQAYPSAHTELPQYRGCASAVG